MSGYITEIHLCVEVKAFHQLVNLPLEAVDRDSLHIFQGGTFCSTLEGLGILTVIENLSRRSLLRS